MRKRRSRNKVKKYGNKKEIAKQLEWRAKLERIEVNNKYKRIMYAKGLQKEKVKKIAFALCAALLIVIMPYTLITQNSFVKAIQYISSAEEDSIEDKKIDTKYTMEMREAVSNPRILDEEELEREKKYDLSDTDYNNLLRIVEAEASGEGEYGKLLVANVVLNRVDSSKFPNSVTNVVFQNSGGKTQFAPTRDGRFYRVKVTQETINAVDRAIYGEDASNGALYFVAAHKAATDKVSWFRNKLTYVCTYGGHEFYR